MKLQFKHQKFQADAAKAVVDVFAGQPYLTTNYRIDNGSGIYQTDMETSFTGWRNEHIVPELNDSIILEHLQKIQRTNQIEPSKQLEGHYNLTIEMETGVGKTYTYIKTMYELNKHYGWSKFIVVVPSVAIREGVYKSFEVTQDHFAEEYGKKIRFFIYNSAQLTEIDRFASDSSINVMIINSQAFNAKGKDARRIYMKLDEFRSRRPIDIIAKTNPILIIDEPQSVEGKQTKERMKEFNPMITLRYSATHRADSIYNMVYRLDAMEAYVKLPDGFYISTPVGKYNPDWAIAFYEGTVKHIYFVAETKGTLDSMRLNHITPVEQAKIDCARAHFKALNDENVVYDVVSDYQTLLNAVMK